MAHRLLHDLGKPVGIAAVVGVIDALLDFLPVIIAGKQLGTACDGLDIDIVGILNRSA
ncbi:hypothetical protein D3C87_2094060 [compost metagenome]